MAAMEACAAAGDCWAGYHIRTVEVLCHDTFCGCPSFRQPDPSGKWGESASEPIDFVLFHHVRDEMEMNESMRGRYVC